MQNRKLRRIPLVCLFLSLFRLLTGELRCIKNYLGQIINTTDGRKYKVFRHITTYPLNQHFTNCVFIVSFRFAHLSHKANKIASIIPMLFITGFPGFIAKIYAVNIEDGYWQGMYQWKSKAYLEEYKKSFVYRMMNKRAIPNSIEPIEYTNQKLSDFIERHRIQTQCKINNKDKTHKIFR